MTDIPINENRGSSGGQSHPPEGTVQIEKSPFQGMSDVLQGLSAGNSRSFGGEIGAGLLRASFCQMEESLKNKDSQLKNKEHQLEELKEKLDQVREELSEYKTEVSVLKERVAANGKIRKLGNISITLGTALVGVAIELYRNKLVSASTVVCFIGVGLIILGWFTGHGDK